MSYKDAPHAAVNELMKWVRKRGYQVFSLHTWPDAARWSSLPDWFARIDMHSTQPLHVRIKRKGYKFVIIHEPDDTRCPACFAYLAASLVSHDVVAQTSKPSLVTQPV